MPRAPLLLFWFSRERGVYCKRVLFRPQTKVSEFSTSQKMAATKSQRAMLNGQYRVFKAPDCCESRTDCSRAVEKGCKAPYFNLHLSQKFLLFLRKLPSSPCLSSIQSATPVTATWRMIAKEIAMPLLTQHCQQRGFQYCPLKKSSKLVKT